MKKFISGLIILTSALVLSAPVIAKDKDKDQDFTYVAKEWPAYEGPKVGLAVLSFEDGLSEGPTANWIEADTGVQVYFGLGEGLSNMFVSTLMSTNRFSIVDKKIARKIFELYSTDTAKKIYVSGTGLPKVPGVKYFVLGSLTGFNDGNDSREGGIGFGGIRLSGGKSVASLVIHMRIIDATNGQVVYSKPVEGLASVKKGGIDLSGLGVDANFSAVLETPLGQAIQMMLDRATEEIISLIGG